MADLPATGPVVRPAAEGDLPQVLALLAQMGASDPVAGPAEAERVWRRLLASDGVTVLVAEDAGRLLASCTLIVVPNLTRNGRAYAFIENVVTDAAHRGRGLGKAVLRAAVERAWQADCYKVLLATGSKRPETLGFYEAAGFTRGTKTAFEVRRT